MQVFLCHAAEDKDVVEPVGSWLSDKGLHVWLDKWSMTPGDSLIEKIGEGIETSDRLVVFLSVHSVESKWVTKEVATGLVMELAEDRGLGEKFVIPVLLSSCKVPIMLRDKIYANFTDKPFESACEELYRGIIDEPLGPQDETFENRIVRFYDVPTHTPGKHGLVIEFGVRLSPTEGLHVGVDVGTPYTNVLEWFGPPNNPTVPSSTGGAFTNSASRREPPIYARKFASPGVTSGKSYYWYFEADNAMKPGEVQFLDFYDREP